LGVHFSDRKGGDKSQKGDSKRYSSRDVSRRKLARETKKKLLGAIFGAASLWRSERTPGKAEDLADRGEEKKITLAPVHTDVSMNRQPEVEGEKARHRVGIKKGDRNEGGSANAKGADGAAKGSTITAEDKHWKRNVSEGREEKRLTVLKCANPPH